MDTQKVFTVKKTKIKYTSVLYLYLKVVRLIKNTEVNTYEQCIAYTLKTTSRRQLAHISKKTTELIVKCYCAWLRSSYIVNLMNSCNELKLSQNT